MSRPTWLTVLLACVIWFTACDSDSPNGPDPNDPETGELVVEASAGTVAPSAEAAGKVAVPIGPPSTWSVGFYGVSLSRNADCSGPFVTAFDSGGPARVVDMVTDPELFRATGLPVGTYPCVAFRISDVMEFQSANAGMVCTPGTTYRGDVYRAGGEDQPFRDLDLSVIPATGSEASPSDDRIIILFTTDPGAAIARGFAPNQVVQLTTPLQIPDRVTFSWDASNAVDDDGAGCRLEPDAPALFR
jgi:hypothetical protein